MKEEFIGLIKNGLTRKNDTMIANVGVDGVINFCKEVWRDTKDEKGFKISNYSRVYDIKKDRMKNIFITGHGYLGTCLNCKAYKLHKLIMNSFYTNTFDLPCVNHKDECKTNNFINNLEFCSEIYNLNYSRQTGMFRGFPKPKIPRKHREIKSIKSIKPKEPKKPKIKIIKEPKIRYIKKTDVEYNTKHKIYCYDKDLNLVKIYDKISDVKDDDFSISCVCRCCRKTYKKAINFYKDFYWSYKPLDIELIFSFNDRLIFS